MKLGISLSGGGVRALVFHLGVLKRLAESKHWDSVGHLSTVSGGSLCVAMIFAKNGGKWPDAEQYLKTVLRAAREQLTTQSLVWSSVRAGFIRPFRLLNGRAHLVAHVLAKKWGATMSLQDLSERPRWTINCTTYETGKNWRFSYKRMGDYLTGYVMNPDFPVADAAAASAGFPGGIGPRKIRSADYQWVQYKEGSKVAISPISPKQEIYHLWDGGVYENLGSEALFKPGKAFRDDVDFYIASDAGKGVSQVQRHGPFGSAKRLLDCAMDQVRAVRARTLHGFLRPPAPSPTVGIYVRMGMSREEIYRQFAPGLPCPSPSPCGLGPDDAKRAAMFPTTLRRLREAEFDLLLNHGYEVADATMATWVPDRF
ncbi:MAG: patatin-like phospholipase family protein [Akkermansiaceae bacterium]|nr:patatin-like phospholipase family protein [Akkermansiaceae bacterium]MCF7730453.1 patatin-like phospholipase family protein [Akkermansiaceae bacterium]